MNYLKTFLLVGWLFLQWGNCAFSQITPAAIDSFFSKSLLIQGYCDLCKTPSGFYKGLQVVHPAELGWNTDVQTGEEIIRYNDMLRLIAHVKPLMVTDVITQWGAGDWFYHINRCIATVADIKSINPNIIVQGSPNEYIDIATTDAVDTIPNWVFQAFNLSPVHRHFNIYAMAFDDYKSNERHRYSYTGINAITNDWNAIQPDISKNRIATLVLLCSPNLHGCRL